MPHELAFATLRESAFAGGLDPQLVRELGEVVPGPRPASDGVAPAALSIAR